MDAPPTAIAQTTIAIQQTRKKVSALPTSVKKPRILHSDNNGELNIKR